MGNKVRGQVRPFSISPPDLPDKTAAETSFDGGLNGDEHYTDIVLSNRNLAGQTAPHVIIEGALFQDVAMAAGQMKFLRLTDARFEDCDLANVDWSQSALNRIKIVDCRMTGIKLIDSELKNVSFEDCKIDLGLFRGCSCKDCRFSNCNLLEADFSRAKLPGVVFSDCDLRGLQYMERI